MRIRKRAVPLPLSLLSPVPIDPLVQLPSSDHHDDLLRHDQQQQQQQPQPLRPIHLRVRLPYEDHDGKNTDQREQQISNTSTKKSDSGAVAMAENGGILSPLTPSIQTKVVALGDGRWCDGDKAIPLKKRKASYEMNGAVVIVAGEAKMKSKTNKKCPLSSTLEQEDQDYDQDDDYDVVDDSDSDSSDDDNKDKKTKKKKKKKKRKNATSGGAKKKPSKGKKKGGGIMEGSRCSRVNGRGWRCMQPTLVGYSLCEHHLGKGRLRSMASVRARAKPASINSDTDQVLLSEIPVEKDSYQEDSTGRDHDQKKPIFRGAGANKKRVRIGMVKARSLSSLLGQPNTSVVQLGSTTSTSEMEHA